MLEVGLRQTYYRYDLSDPMHLGMKVDPEGNNIEHTAHPRELVCTRPHPSLALDSGAMTLAKSSDERISACILVSPPFHFPKCCQQTNALQGFGGSLRVISCQWLSTPRQRE